MNRIALILIAAFSLAAFAAAQGQNTTISGFVANGTTHKPAAGDQVTLIRLSQGMEEEAHTRTDGRGAFKFTIGDGGLPHLVRVHHDDVNYHEPVPPGTNSVQVTVYNSVAKVPGLQLLDESQVFEANDTLLKVVEVFRVRNSAFPPVTQPAFEFYLPEGATPRLSQA
ncbi:MAG: carboxypeptidase regulatory-like domain-containing protein, partial [Candidatus Angelobacter sp.]